LLTKINAKHISSFSSLNQNIVSTSELHILVNQGFTYPVTDNQEEYKRSFVKVFSIPHSIDINTSNAQTPHNLQEHHRIHKPETKRDIPSRLDDVNNTNLSSCPSDSGH
jgi:hypothetical protein